MKTTSILWPVLAATIATLGVAIHLAAIAGGPSWYAWFGAPPVIVASAREGTWLAPASAAGIAVLMGVCAAYACSAIGIVRRLPWRRPVLAAIAAICLLRALLLVPLAIRFPALLTPFEIGAALAWGCAGIGFAVAFLHAGKLARRHPEQGRA